MKKIILILFLAAIFFQNANICAAQELLSDSINKVDKVQKGEKIVIPGFYFDAGSSAVKASLRNYIKQISSAIKKIKYTKIYVDGYTDNRGDNAFNNRLSRARANAVRNELIKNGVPSKKVQARAYGSIKPIASNDTSAGRVQNRRIEIIVR